MRRRKCRTQFMTEIRLPRACIASVNAVLTKQEIASPVDYPCQYQRRMAKSGRAGVCRGETEGRTVEWSDQNRPETRDQSSVIRRIACLFSGSKPGIAVDR